MKKILKESKNMLDGIVGEETSNDILNNMFPPPIKGYKKGNILKVKELKALPKNTIIHLLYEEGNGCLRNNGFVKFCGDVNTSTELRTADGFSMPMEGHSEDELIKDFDNCGWYFTVSEAIKE
jgi:hypothetical protein